MQLQLHTAHTAKQSATSAHRAQQQGRRHPHSLRAALCAHPRTCTKTHTHTPLVQAPLDTLQARVMWQCVAKHAGQPHTTTSLGGPTRHCPPPASPYFPKSRETHTLSSWPPNKQGVPVGGGRNGRATARLVQRFRPPGPAEGGTTEPADSALPAWCFPRDPSLPQPQQEGQQQGGGLRSGPHSWAPLQQAGGQAGLGQRCSQDGTLGEGPGAEPPSGLLWPCHPGQAKLSCPWGWIWD